METATRRMSITLSLTIRGGDPLTHEDMEKIGDGIDGAILLGHEVVDGTDCREVRDWTVTAMVEEE